LYYGLISEKIEGIFAKIAKPQRCWAGLPFHRTRLGRTEPGQFGPAVFFPFLGFVNC
jgi:hypothetical protein